MKKNLLCFAILASFLSSAVQVSAQSAPVWTRDLTTFPDSAGLFPVRVLSDDNNQVWILSTYWKTITPGVNQSKIYLTKYDSAGNLAWTLVYDHGGIGYPRGYDMAIDPSGNAYIVGSVIDSQSVNPLIIKVTAAGSVDWERDTIPNFFGGQADQIFIRNNFIHFRCDGGIAKFDLNGNEEWTVPLATGRMALDHAGQTIVVTHFGNPINLQRYDSTGALNFSAVTIHSKRIAVDSHNDFYVMTDNFPNYDLVKFDSAGSLQWSHTLPQLSSPFGDIGYEVLTDYQDDVLLVGINDSIFKLSPSGTQLWGKSMNGMDSYQIAAKIAYGNLLAVAGSVPDSNGYNLRVATYDLQGNENWAGFYNGNTMGQEFTVDMALDNSGVYVVENNDNNTTLVKFDGPFYLPINYNLVCVDSVWYDPLNPIFINVRIFNGNISHLNYPSVRIVSPTNDTIGNPSNFVTFFAHLGNGYLVYTDTITVAGITDFSNYTFLIHEGIDDSTAVIDWCLPQGIPPVTRSEIRMFPNPAHDVLLFKVTRPGQPFQIEIYNSQGAKVLERTLESQPLQQVDISGFANGIYFVRFMQGGEFFQGRFVRY